jgi:hypothetical protein
MNNSSSLVFKDKEKLLLITDFKRVVKILIHLSKKILIFKRDRAARLNKENLFRFAYNY